MLKPLTKLMTSVSIILMQKLSAFYSSAWSIWD